MVSNPGDLLDAFADAGADGCTVHVELGDPRPLFDRIRALGMRVGLTFEPETPYGAVEPYLGEIDVLLVMSVKTGFGGQPFIASVLDKARAAREAIDAKSLPSRSRSTAASPSRPRRSRPRRSRHPRRGHRGVPRPDPAAAVEELRAVASTVSGSR